MTILIKKLADAAKREQAERERKYKNTVKDIEELLYFFESNKDLTDVCETLEACGITSLNIAEEIREIGYRHRITAWTDGSLRFEKGICEIRYQQDELYFISQGDFEYRICLREYYVDCDIVELMTKFRYTLDSVDYTFIAVLREFVKALSAYIPEIKDFFINVNISDYGYTEQKD